MIQLQFGALIGYRPEMDNYATLFYATLFNETIVSNKEKKGTRGSAIAAVNKR